MESSEPREMPLIQNANLSSAARLRERTAAFEIHLPPVVGADAGPGDFLFAAVDEHLPGLAARPRRKSLALSGRYFGPQSCSTSAAMVFIRPTSTILRMQSWKSLVAWSSPACANACRMHSSGVI